jgi:hypothetical protein
VVLEPEQSEDHPVNADPAAAVAVSVTRVPSPKFAEHVDPQLMPAGLDVTVPLPAPAFVTVSACGKPNVAVTSRAWLIVTWHVVLVPEQSPDQPEKLDPPPAAAVSVTSVPSV